MTCNYGGWGWAVEGARLAGPRNSTGRPWTFFFGGGRAGTGFILEHNRFIFPFGYVSISPLYVGCFCFLFMWQTFLKLEKMDVNYQVKLTLNLPRKFSARKADQKEVLLQEISQRLSFMLHSRRRLPMMRAGIRNRLLWRWLCWRHGRAQSQGHCSLISLC